MTNEPVPAWIILRHCMHSDHARVDAACPFAVSHLGCRRRVHVSTWHELLSFAPAAPKSAGRGIADRTAGAGSHPSRLARYSASDRDRHGRIDFFLRQAAPLSRLWPLRITALLSARVGA